MYGLNLNPKLPLSIITIENTVPSETKKFRVYWSTEAYKVTTCFGQVRL